MVSDQWSVGGSLCSDYNERDYNEKDYIVNHGAFNACGVVCRVQKQRGYVTESNAKGKQPEYYNSKAIANLSSLIGRDKDGVEDWIYETFDKNEITPPRLKTRGLIPLTSARTGSLSCFSYLMRVGQDFLLSWLKMNRICNSAVLV